MATTVANEGVATTATRRAPTTRAATAPTAPARSSPSSAPSLRLILAVPARNAVSMT
jgi:hypothetical protein